MVGERAVGPLDEDSGPGLEPAYRLAIVPRGLYGQAHHGWPGQGRQRIRVRLPPQPLCQEAPLEKLPAGYRQTVDPAAPANDRVHARRLLFDTLDAQLVTSAPQQGDNEAVRDHQPRRSCPRHSPNSPSQGMADKRRPRRYLVREGKGEGHVGVEVHHPPCFVLEPMTGDPNRRDGDHDEQAERDSGGQDIGIGGQEGPKLSQCPGFCRLGVAQSYQHHVGGDQPECPGRQAAVPTHEAVLADSSLQPTDAGDQQQHDEH